MSTFYSSSSNETGFCWHCQQQVKLFRMWKIRIIIIITGEKNYYTLGIWSSLTREFLEPEYVICSSGLQPVNEKRPFSLVITI